MHERAADDGSAQCSGRPAAQGLPRWRGGCRLEPVAGTLGQESKGQTGPDSPPIAL